MEDLRALNIFGEFGESQVVEIDFEAADSIAEDYFKTMCGFTGNDPKRASKLEGMLKTAEGIRDRIRDRISIRAAVTAFGSETISGHRFERGSVTIECNAFEQIDIDHVRKVYAYILTAGSFELESDSVLEQFYADTWGTAYVDAGRDLLQKLIVEQERDSANADEPVFITDSFGPGYYGMDLSQVESLFSLLDHDAIGVTLSSATCMMPIKSCTGFFITTDEEAGMFSDDCRSCLSRDKGCSFCRYRLKGTCSNNGTTL